MNSAAFSLQIFALASSGTTVLLFFGAANLHRVLKPMDMAFTGLGGFGCDSHRLLIAGTLSRSENMRRRDESQDCFDRWPPRNQAC
jgi:hypothetical protein